MSLGHLQRGGPPTPFDRILGTRMGNAAVHALASGQSGVFTGFCDMEIRLVPISVAAGKTRKVLPDGPAVRCARETGIAFGDR